MPTPSATDGNGGPKRIREDGRTEADHGPTLRDLTPSMHLLPTPVAAEGTKPSNTMGVARRAATGEVFLPNVIVTLEGMDPTETSALLPTPAVNDMGAAYTPEMWDEWTARMKAEHKNGNGHGASLNIEAQRLELLPTPRAEERQQQNSRDDYVALSAISRWGKYAAAIARWEAVTRPAPDPTNITDGYLRERAKRLAGKHKKPVGMRGSLKPRRQLAARFSEWMMGVPLGWITDVPGITRNEALKAAGNGVVPQQAAEALRFLLEMPTGRDIADAHEPLDLFELLALDA